MRALSQYPVTHIVTFLYFWADPMESEEKIIRSLNNGSHEAFRAIYDVHKFRILAIISRLVVSPPLAEELFQKVFIKLWDNRANVDPGGSLAAYLNTIARNEVYSYWRKTLNKRLMNISLSAELPEDVILEEEVENEDYRRYLFSLAEGLPAKCRQVFDMRFSKQMSYREIAHDLDISESTVENQISKSLKHIRRRLANSVDIVILLAASGFFS